ncbi:gliding motility-associated C-terminal domain-containing protein [Myroides sp. 1354]|uniref:gliding motility-associated C-terminal domain-containing protein n=1 Tax=unclassified Myroides TaxID=2642485 RepID=UPI00257534B8|nr:MULTISPECIES: gliding motility-associated C-terminal domain-containing protein [unclassified Myroides]MDM1044694.1 gliding motility-associated C-terminal domain-containing protein [Myroides sp. R163-1]MDM1055407.1 gliding motility-associated C-terminal domain-containing protein [Myroides sp. 1354]MDM1068704.1 gliding motility-associated C-terminal domain-containing protein [Myroides sp. 1372]
MKKNYFFTIVILGYLILLSDITKAQDPIFLNGGILYINKQTLLSSYLPFVNTDRGFLINDGEIHYHNTTTNEGIFSFTKRLSAGKVSFFQNDSNPQLIRGNRTFELNQVHFKSDQPQVSFFDLKANLDIEGELDFVKGIIKVDSTQNETTKVSKGMITFLETATHKNASNWSHIEGEVEKKGGREFTFPIGDKGVLRPVKISATGDVQNSYQAKYKLDDTTFFETHTVKAGIIDQINTREYWTVIKGQNNSEKQIKLTLSWQEDYTPISLIKNPEKDLHIVRWDEQQQLWVDEGGVVDLSSKEVTTIAPVKGYGYFTLATVKKNWMLDGDLVIYNLVTPNGDGKNDYFIIANINQYPNNRVEVYNRWGVRVYETTNYDSKGDGSENVFRGYAKGKNAIDQSQQLPSGTYYYVITYEYKDEKGSRMIKKAANLHLETN